MNIDKLKQLIRSKSKAYNLDTELMYRNYMFERFIERISRSKYKEHLIIKGGYLIGSMIGVEKRVTKDIDTTLKDLQLEKQKMIEIFQEISAIDCDDEIIFEFKRITEIREQFDYLGYRIFFDAIIQKTVIHLKMDITTGDVIVPDAIDYEHQCLFENRVIQIKSYTIETILAEKLESIIVWGITGTRLRDYYDVYMLIKNFKSEINLEQLSESLKSTVIKRKTMEQIQDYQEIMQAISTDEYIQNSWQIFQTSFEYAKNIDFHDTIKAIWKMLNDIPLDDWQ